MPDPRFPKRVAESALRIVVTGLIAQHHTLAGVTWDYVQYAAGLARLGHDVYYFEDSGEWPYNVDGGPSGNDYIARDCTPNIEHLARTMARFGLGERWAYRFPLEPRWFGLSDQKRGEVLASADLLINVSGTLEHPENYGQVRRLAYIDSDPVFTQVKLAQGTDDFRRRVDAHDVHFSFGERLSEAVPVTGHHWRPTRQPVLLSEWQPLESCRDAFTTVMSWTSYKPLVYGNRSYGQKDVELRQFLQLPTKVVPAVLEIALSSTHHLDWELLEGTSIQVPLNGAPLTPRYLLTSTGWRVVDPDEECSSLDDYRRYLRSSKAEWSVAKNGYVVGQPGWFSCRSACYLAAGRPVVVQDTGFSSILPVGEGILPFRTMEEAVAGIHEVEKDYARHARAARAIAEEYFDSDSVLSRLVNEAMNSRD
jgi:hypothetical protein